MQCILDSATLLQRNLPRNWVALRRTCGRAAAAVAGPGHQPGAGGVPVPCKQGYVKRNAGNFACSACPSGTIQPGTGHTACIKCPAGRTNNAARSYCGETHKMRSLDVACTLRPA